VSLTNNFFKLIADNTPR